MQEKEHWEKVYSTKAVDEVSWFQKHAEISIRLIRASGASTESSIIDVGGGASVLADDLLKQGYRNISVLDLSGAALEKAKARLNEKSSAIRWIEANVLEYAFERHEFDVWHDRAVFHFLTSKHERDAYVSAVMRAVKPGGNVIVATFAEDGPTSCSGLPVMRYSSDELHAEFGDSFQLLGHEKEVHHTPGGKDQKFVYCFCKKMNS